MDKKRGYKIKKSVKAVTMDRRNSVIKEFLNPMVERCMDVPRGTILCALLFLGLMPRLFGQTTIDVAIDLDSYEGETSWTLTGPSGFFQSGGPYTSADDLIDQSFVVTQSGTYTFTINDTFGDGLSDNISSTNENTLAGYGILVDGTSVFQSTNLPNFGLSDVQAFTVAATDPCTDPSGTDTDGDGISDVCDLDDDNDGILDGVECPGIFCLQPIVNESFEAPTISIGSYAVLTEGSVPGWQTTATDNMIEIWSSGFMGVPSFDGNQFAELNANLTSALYQDLCLTPGSEIQWSVRHRGRMGIDVAVVRIGADITTATTQATMSDGTSSWGYYSGTYIVPTGQTSTAFIFEALSAAGGVTQGNLIDDVQISVISTPSCPDSDNDGISNYLDIDADNDGIFDLVEAGNGNLDLDNDGRIDSTIGSVGNNGIFDIIETSPDSGVITSRFEAPDTDGDGNRDPQDTDSDGDGCLDVVEAGFTESGSKPGELQGTGYNSNGSVSGNIDGYTLPTDADGNTIFDFQQAAPPTSITTQPNNVVVPPGGTASFSVVGSNTDTYQWQLFNGTLWVDLTDSGIYNGVHMNTLTISAPTPSENGNQYRVIVSNSGFICSAGTTSNAALLTVRVRTIITNRGRTFRVKKN